jgi:very-short-patch-repair endonuclease
LQFAEKDGALQANRIAFSAVGTELLEAQYGPAATVWRINLGWRRRKEKSIHGFNIDVTTGLWAKDAQAPDDDSNGEGDTRTPPQRIIPFVEDRRNVFIVRPGATLDHGAMATLQYALKRGIEREFQLEESELMVEPLPDRDKRYALLFYEAAEGGAGVLTRLATDPEAICRVAARALDVCHFERTGEHWVAEELRNTDTSCEAGCYGCLLSYYNQPDHGVIDRQHKEVRELLCRLAHAEARKGSEGRTAEDQFAELWRLSSSSLEHAWLTVVRDQDYHLPDRAQRLIEEHGTRPDFAYSRAQALIYVDGPHHDGDAQKRLDAAITDRLEDAGYTVIRFGVDRATWSARFRAYPDIFGKGTRA